MMRLVEEVQGAVFSGKVAFEAPKMFKIAKGREGGVMQYREVASFERLADRVILSRMTAYVRDRLEGVLSDRCYSFRRDRDVTHQLAVKRLQEFRERFPAGSLFVAECDIKKFFDSISHEVVHRRWREVGFEDAAGKVLEAYLGVYAAEEADAQERVPPVVGSVGWKGATNGWGASAGDSAGVAAGAGSCLSARCGAKAASRASRTSAERRKRTSRLEGWTLTSTCSGGKSMNSTTAGRASARWRG